MDANEIKEKYQKYKLKYLNIKQKGGTDPLPSNEDISIIIPIKTLTPDVLMAIIVLYNKLLYSYILYRFRYDNTHTLIDIADLSDKIFILLQNKSIKDQYKNKYIKNLLDLPKEEIDKLIQEPYEPLNPNRIVFTLRKDTATVLRDLYLINNESIKTINNYINFLNNYNLKTGPYSEIYEKCLQIKGLVAPGITPFIPNKIETELDKIRNESSIIINIIGDDFNNTMNNLGIKPNNLNEEKNDVLNRLFKTNFRALTKMLDSNFCNYS